MKSKIFGFGTALLKCWTTRISELLDGRLKEFCCTYSYDIVSLYMFSTALSTAIVSQYVHVTVLMFTFHLERSESRMFRNMSLHLQGGSNMTGTSAACLRTNQSRSYLNHVVHTIHAPFYEFLICAVIFSKSTPPHTHKHTYTMRETCTLNLLGNCQDSSFLDKYTGTVMIQASNVSCLMFYSLQA